MNRYIYIALQLSVLLNGYLFSARFLYVFDKFPWYTKSIIVNQITGLLDRGHEVNIYSRKKKSYEFIEDKIIEYNLLDKTIYETIPYKNLNSYDAIICQYGSEGKIFAKLKKKYNFRGKLVTCIRGGDITSKKELGDNLYNELFSVGDLFLPVCEYFKARLIALGCPFKKIAVLHSAIDSNQFAFKKRFLNNPFETINIVTVCRLYEEKAIDFVIRAIVEVKKKYKDFHIHYTVVGNGPEYDKLKTLIKKLSLEMDVDLLGWKSQEDIVRILDQSHIFVLPSVTAIRGAQEGIPNALKEAMAMGLPVISTYHAGIPELVEDGVSGILVPERELSSLIAALSYLIENSSLWAKMGEAGRKKVEKEFESVLINNQFFEIMSELLEINI